MSANEYVLIDVDESHFDLITLLKFIRLQRELTPAIQRRCIDSTNHAILTKVLTYYGYSLKSREFDKFYAWYFLINHEFAHVRLRVSQTTMDLVGAELAKLGFRCSKVEGGWLCLLPDLRWDELEVVIQNVFTMLYEIPSDDVDKVVRCGSEMLELLSKLSSCDAKHWEATQRMITNALKNLKPREQA